MASRLLNRLGLACHVALAVLALVFASHGMAQTPAPVAAGQTTASSNSDPLVVANQAGAGADAAWRSSQQPIYESLGEVVNGKTGVASISSSLSGVGLKLAGTLFVIMLAWTGLMGVLQNSHHSETLAQAFRLCITMGFVLLFLGQVPGVGPVGGLLISSANSIGQSMVGGSTNDGISAVGVFGNAVTQLLGDAMQSYIDQLTNSKILGGASENTVVIAVLGFILLLFRAVAALFVVVAGCVFIGVYVVSQIMVLIAVAFAPVMVPWLLVERANWIFDGWLKFTLSAGLQKAVGMAMFAITSGMMTKVSALASRVSPTGAIGAIDFGAVFALFLLAALTAYLMWQVPGIAQGLLNGNAIPGGLRGGGLMGATGAGPLRSMNPSMRSVSSSARGFGRAAAVGVKAGRAAANAPAGRRMEAARSVLRSTTGSAKVEPGAVAGAPPGRNGSSGVSEQAAQQSLTGTASGFDPQWK